MPDFRSFAFNAVLVVICALAGLLVSGSLLTWAEGGYRHAGSFFTYRIYHLDNLPAWFVFSFALLAINGFWMFRLAQIEGLVQTPAGGAWGGWSAALPINPLRLFAINLITIPFALALFLVVRAYSW